MHGHTEGLAADVPKALLDAAERHGGGDPALFDFRFRLPAQPLDIEDAAPFHPLEEAAEQRQHKLVPAVRSVADSGNAGVGAQARQHPIAAVVHLHLEDFQIRHHDLGGFGGRRGGQGEASARSRRRFIAPY